MKIVSLIPIVIVFGLFACNSDTRQVRSDETITREILILNSTALENINQQVIVPINVLQKGDTILLESNVRMYLFGKDSINGKNLPVFANSKLVYAYPFRKSLVFDIYDSLENLLDRGMLPEGAAMRLMNADIDFRKVEFYDKLMEERNRNYEEVARKYAISRTKLDSLIQVQLAKK